MKNIAVILAGGIGSRLNAGIPKQFLKVAGLTVIEHTVAAFQRHTQIDEIAIVVSQAYHHKMDEYVVGSAMPTAMQSAVRSASIRWIVPDK